MESNEPMRFYAFFQLIEGAAEEQSFNGQPETTKQQLLNSAAQNAQEGFLKKIHFLTF